MHRTTHRSSMGIPHVFSSVEKGSNPVGDRDPPNNPKTPLRERERERGGGTQWEEGQRGGERRTERRRGNEREGGGEGEREPQRDSRGLTGTLGG